MSLCELYKLVFSRGVNSRMSLTKENDSRFCNVFLSVLPDPSMSIQKTKRSKTIQPYFSKTKPWKCQRFARLKIQGHGSVKILRIWKLNALQMYTILRTEHSRPRTNIFFRNWKRKALEVYTIFGTNLRTGVRGAKPLGESRGGLGDR